MTEDLKKSVSSAAEKVAYYEKQLIEVDERIVENLTRVSVLEHTLSSARLDVQQAYLQRSATSINLQAVRSKFAKACMGVPAVAEPKLY